MVRRGRVRRRQSLLALPVAVATVTSVIFGLNVKQIDVEKSTDDSPAEGQAARTHSRPQTGAATSREKLRDGSYIVRAGDTVADIAADFRVSSAELLASNGLSWRTMLTVGQRLVIPTNTSGTADYDRVDSVTRHHVRAGDTLEAIARSYQVQPRALMSANGLGRGSRLIVGQRLLIPNANVMSGLEALS